MNKSSWVTEHKRGFQRGEADRETWKIPKSNDTSLSCSFVFSWRVQDFCTPKPRVTWGCWAWDSALDHLAQLAFTVPPFRTLMEYKSEANWFAHLYTATLLRGSEMRIQISFQPPSSPGMWRYKIRKNWRNCLEQGSSAERFAGVPESVSSHCVIWIFED